MKPIKYLVQILIIIGLLGVDWVGLSYAQAKPSVKAYPEAPASISTNLITSTQSITTTPGQAEISFENLGLSETILNGPFDAMTVSMYLPASWKLTGGTLNLDFTVFFSGIGQTSVADSAQILGGSLAVTFNGKLLEMIQLDHIGDYHLTIPLTAKAATSPGKNGRHELRLSLDSALSCRFDTQTIVSVHPISKFNVSYQDVPLPTDLRLFPYPIFQQSLVPDVAIVVVPDQPSAEELQAALTTVAGLGHLTSGKINLSLIPISQLTNEVKVANHLIFVGEPDHLPLLTVITLPAPPAKAGFEPDEAGPDDGIIQIARSPWNSDKLVLLVSGNSAKGVIKAGEATSSGFIRVGQRSDLAVVTDVLPLQEETAPLQAEDQTFTDLGYVANQLAQRGTNWAEYHFNIPPGKTITPDAYFDLIFNHSALLDYDQSDMVISLNGETIAAVKFSDESTNEATDKIALPRHAIHSGINTLLFRAELLPKANCTNPDTNTLWMNISPDSKLHLPLTDNPVQLITEFDLKKYPEPFIPSQTLGDTAIVLSPTDSASWQTAAQLAFDLGRRITGSLVSLKTVFGDNLPDDVRRQYHLLVIGKASRLPIIAELRDTLPAPFEPGNDLAKEENVNIIYRFPQGTDMGYIELVPAPWANNRAVIAILGSTNLGLDWAAQALIIQDLQNQLSGNFAVINDKQIVVGNIRTRPLSLELISPPITDTPIANTEVSTPEEVTMPAVAAPSTSKHNAGYLPVIATSIGLMILIIVLVILTSRRR